MLEDGGCYSRQEDQKERLQTLRVRHKLLVFYIFIVHKNARLLIINLQASRQSWPFPIAKYGRSLVRVSNGITIK